MIVLLMMYCIAGEGTREKCRSITLINHSMAGKAAPAPWSQLPPDTANSNTSLGEQPDAVT